MRGAAAWLERQKVRDGRSKGQDVGLGRPSTIETEAVPEGEGSHNLLRDEDSWSACHPDGLGEGGGPVSRVPLPHQGEPQAEVASLGFLATPALDDAGNDTERGVEGRPGNYGHEIHERHPAIPDAFAHPDSEEGLGRRFGLVAVHVPGQPPGLGGRHAERRRLGHTGV